MDTSSSARGCVSIVTPKPLSRRIECASVKRRAHGKRGVLRGSAPTDNHTGEETYRCSSANRAPRIVAHVVVRRPSRGFRAVDGIVLKVLQFQFRGPQPGFDLRAKIAGPRARLCASFAKQILGFCQCVAEILDRRLATTPYLCVTHFGPQSNPFSSKKSPQSAGFPTSPAARRARDYLTVAEFLRTRW